MRSFRASNVALSSAALGGTLALVSAACSSDEGGNADDMSSTGGALSGSGGAFAAGGSAGNGGNAGGVIPPMNGGAPSTGGAVNGSGGAGVPPLTPGASDWTQLGYDPASTYFNRAETTITKQNAGSLGVAWTKDLGANIYSAPLHVGDRLYVAGVSVQALNAATGDLLWEAPLATTAAMAYEAGTLYVHDGFAILHALDAATGASKWQADVSEHPSASGFSSPIVAGNHVFVGGSTGSELGPTAPSFRGHVTAVDKNTGALAWVLYTVPENATGASLWSSVSVDLGSNRVFATTGNNYTHPATDTSDAFLALNVGTGAIEWKSQRRADDVWSTAVPGGPDFDFGANPVLYEAEVGGTMTPLVAAGQKSGDAHAVRRDTGDLVWTRSLGPGNSFGSQGVFNNTTWTGTHLLIAVNGATSAAPGGEPQAATSNTTSVLFALHGGTGEIIWERQLPGEVMAPITVANGVGFVGAGTTLEVFDVDTGALLKTFSVEGTIACPPTVGNGRVAFGNGLAWVFGRPGSTLTVLAVQ